MILRILFVTLTIFPSLSLGKMNMVNFTKKFEDMCFQNEPTDPFRVNGQDRPLSNTLENFIALAEKFEEANNNPDINIKDELVYFLSEYVFENIQFTSGSATVWSEGSRANFDKIDALWDPDINVDAYLKHPRPVYNDPFSDAEKCSLFYMISHSILNKDTALQQQSRSYSQGNFSSMNIARTQELVPDEYFPQEMGVVAIQGTDAAVSLSKVLKGLFVGLKEYRKRDLNSFFNDNDKLEIEEEKLPTDKTVDTLFAVTLADVLVRAEFPGSDRMGLTPNGEWISIKINSEKEMKGFCPMVYKHQLPNGSKQLPAYSYSSVRGAADGLILGLAVDQVYAKKQKIKLSQILRMYYSPEGISLESKDEDLNSNHVSFCNRQTLMDSFENKLADQLHLYTCLITQSLKDINQGFEKAKSLYNKEKGTIFYNSNSEITNYCGRSTSLETPEKLPRETYLDVIVVMDTSNSENSFQEQQMIAGYLAKHMDLRHTGSQMTILLDRKDPLGPVSSSKIYLEPVVSDTYSSSCAACTVAQIPYEKSTLARDEVIIGIDQFLEERKENETKFNGVNGKVVVYFNYENDDGRDNNNKIQGSLQKALRNLHLRHQDVLFYAVGLDSKLLNKYTKNVDAYVLLGNDGTQEEVAKRLHEKISLAPALLQHSECEDEKTDRTVSYESLVSPHALQHYLMPAEYFYKSLKISFKFESQNGNIRVCESRATPEPENEKKSCQDATGNSFVEFKMTNPCKGFSKETCSPFYFSVIGMNENEGEMKTNNKPKDYCDDFNGHWCANLDQIKFKVSHTGVRCSGCLGLGAPPAVILFTLLLTFLIYKRF